MSFDLFFLIDSFVDSVRRRCSVLQWHPDVATQLVVASDEDGSPMLRVMVLLMILLLLRITICWEFVNFWYYCKQLWDMRNIMSPVKEFVGHTKGNHA